MIKDFFDKYIKKPTDRILVAVSGGADSVALTLILNDYCKQNNIDLRAVTVDHGVREGSADEANALSKMLQEKGVNHEILTIDEIPTKNIEANLRRARYDLLYKHCIKNQIKYCFVGHHKDDLAENFLIRLFRGSQLDGVYPMQSIFDFKQVKICRPLLENSKEELISYLKERDITWFEDPSNEDEKFTRNKIRKFLNELEEKDLIASRIAKFGEVLKDAKEFEDEICLQAATEMLMITNDGDFIIDLEKYRNLHNRIALKILSLVLIEVSGDVYKPRLEGLERFEADILQLEKSKKRNFYGCYAKLLTKSNYERVLQQLGEQQKSQIIADPNRFLLIYPQNELDKSKIEDYNEDFKLVGGKFLISQGGDKKFYFRTILKKLFYENSK